VRLQFTNLLVADLDSLRVLGVIDFGAHGQAGAGGGRGDQVDHDLMTGQGLAAPVGGDAGEQPVLELG
jgi:hypothetical protein